MSPDAPTPDVTPTTDAALLAGRYQVLEKLGEGGMGAVFRARDAKLDRPVALKMLPTGSVHDPAAVARFKREAKALARLSHPNIIQAHDSGEDGDKHFLVMELVEGHSLSRELAAKGKIAPTRAADYAHQAALALHHAHQHGLVHRDVKPSNLLLGRDGRVKLLDLGLARFLQDQVGDASLTRDGTGMGTPDYAAPEQFLDAHKADARSDVYSLGCTLYHLIAGRVPFPGSSLSEKVEAHERQEPVPLEEICPDLPGGLALVVQRMMAKRPGDRFQSMAEVSEALTPYIAGSSASFQAIRKSSTWDGSRLATMPALGWRRSRAVAVVAGVALLGLLSFGLLGLAAGWFRPLGQQVAMAPEPTGPDTGKPVPPEDTAKSPPPGTAKEETKKQENRTPSDDPNVLTVSKEEKDGGKYRTIGDALEMAQAGQTIRVLDGSVYRESLSLTRASQHAGITLEAVKRAVLEIATDDGRILEIDSVPGVTVRGFRLRAKNARRCALVVTRRDSGIRLERLELVSEGGGRNNDMELYGVGSGATGPSPTVVQGCTFRGLNAGVLAGDPSTELSLDRVAVRDSLFVDCFIGVTLQAGVRHSQVVGNRFWGITGAATQLQLLVPRSEDILIANNSFVECVTAFRLWDSAPKGREVRFRNNLVLASRGLDLLFRSATDIDNSPMPGDGRTVVGPYAFGHNWREGAEPAGEDAKGWIPLDPKKGEVLAAKIDGVTRDPKSPDFLRPDPKSKLATEGAGNEDPSLPRYVGALPPEGTEPWDWDRAWRMPRDAELRTVSKDSKDKAQFTSINDALKDPKPWMTVRVLDDATYDESITLDDRGGHTGLSLEAPRHATIHMPPKKAQALTIRDLSHVRISGFRFTDTGGDARDFTRTMIHVSGAVQGSVLHGLELKLTLPVAAIVLQGVTAGEGEEPVRVERCVVRSTAPSPNEGIIVIGTTATSSQGIIIRDNRLLDTLRGVTLIGQVDRAFVAGNLVGNCKQAGLDFANLSSPSRQIQVVNNTAFGNSISLRFSEKRSDDKYEGGGAIVNNLIFDGVAADIAYIANIGPNSRAGVPATLRSAWRWRRNWRDFSGIMPELILPVSKEADRQFDRRELASFNLETGTYPRPAKGLPLATQGEGEVNPLLPVYVGAVPPDGVSAWDWEPAVRAWLRKAEPKK